MNTSIITYIAVAAALVLLTIIVWRLTHKRNNDEDLPEVLPEELTSPIDTSVETKVEPDEEPTQTVEDYVASVASELVDSEGSLTSAKLEVEGQDSVLVISEEQLKEANQKFEESLKVIGIDPTTGSYINSSDRKTEQTAKANKKPAKKSTNKTVKEQASTKKKLEKHPEKAVKSTKNNNARQNKAVNGKKNKKKPTKK